MDAYTAARFISEWTSLVPDLIPAKLKTIIDTFDEVGFVEEPHLTVNPATVTVKNVRDTVADLAAAIAAQKRFTEARSQVQHVLAVEVLQTAGEVAEAVIDGLEPDFDKTVDGFVSAVGMLPEDLSAANLLHAGTGAVAAYQEAVAHQDALKRFDRFAASLTYLPTYPAAAEPVLRLLAPSTRNELKRLLTAQEGTKRRGEYGDLSPLWVEAVRAGVRWRLATPLEAADLRREIEAQPVEKVNHRFVSVY
jgi:hypothetical protein